MRKAGTLALIGALAIVCVGCRALYTAPVMPPQGAIFSDISAPVSTEFDDGPPVAMKEGKASTTMILYLFAFGDASVNSAAEEGGIRTIYYVDYRLLNVLGIYSRFTTVVHGE